MQNTSNVLADIEAIIARAMQEVGADTTSTTPTDTQPAAWETISPVEDPVIPTRNNTVVINEATSRFSGAIWYEEIQKQKVILAGVGGIGRIC